MAERDTGGILPGWVRRAIGPVLVFEAGAILALLLVLDPLIASLIQRLIAVGGDPFTGNAAMIGFVLSPAGFVALATAVIIAFAILALQLGGLGLIVADAMAGVEIRVGRVWRRLAARLPALAVLAAVFFVALVVLLIPVAAVAALVHALWLSDADIYYHLTTHSAALRRSILIVGSVGVLAALGAFFLITRWALAVPIVVLDGVGPFRALRLSAEGMAGRRRGLTGRLVLWAVVMLAISALAAFGLDQAQALLLAPEASLAALWRASLALLLLNALTGASLTVLWQASLAVLLARFHLGAEGIAHRRAIAEPPPERTRFTRLAAAAVLVALPVVAVAQAGFLIDQSRIEGPLYVTAHRAGSYHTPENTFAALDKAIAAGADAVEIDVQETADGVVVVLHDTDLRRVAGVPRSIWEMTYAEIADLDVGSWFDPAFSAERIPTLEAFAARAKGHIKLNIELKENGHGVDLAGRSLAAVRAAGLTNAQAAFSSLDLRLLTRIRALDPKTETGFILAAGVGNPRRLDVDFFALASRIATPGFIRSLRASDHAVHVWGVYGADAIAGAWLDGADTVIVDDPKVAIDVRTWLMEMSPAELAVVRLRKGLAYGRSVLRPVFWHA
ncbi:glycerophosphodiester phosphodiesterase family protein [Segnochrobactraceae bacterium EtOH-i3]